MIEKHYVLNQAQQYDTHSLTHTHARAGRGRRGQNLNYRRLPLTPCLPSRVQAAPAPQPGPGPGPVRTSVASVRKEGAAPCGAPSPRRPRYPARGTARALGPDRNQSGQASRRLAEGEARRRFRRSGSAHPRPNCRPWARAGRNGSTAARQHCSTAAGLARPGQRCG